MLLHWGCALQDKFINTKVRGSYTIEATFIVPIILYIIIGLIYLGFYLHDYGKIHGIIHEGQLRGKNLVGYEVDIDTGIQSYEKYLDRTIFYPLDNDFPEKEEDIKNYIYKRCEGKLLIAKVYDVGVRVGFSNVSISVKSKIKFPMRIVKEMLIGSENLIIESKEKNHNPVNFIRFFEIASKTGEKIDINKIIQDLKK